MITFNRFSQNAKILSDKYGISPEISVQVQQQLEGLGDDRGKLMRFIKKHKDKMDKDKNLKPLTLEQIKGFELDIDRSGGEYVWAKGISQDVREQDWLVKLLRNGRAKIGEDDFKLRDLLGKFNKVKMMSGFPNKKKDIMGYKDDGELFEEVSKWKTDDEVKNNNDKMVFKQGSKLLEQVRTYDGELKLYEINTIEAILVAAKGTNWCVRDRRAAENYSLPYHYFSMDDEPYLLINKSSDQVKDVNDTVPKYSVIENVDDLIEKYNLSTHEGDFRAFDDYKMEAKNFNDNLKNVSSNNSAGSVSELSSLITFDNISLMDSSNLDKYKEYVGNALKNFIKSSSAYGFDSSELDTLISVISRLFSGDEEMVRDFTDMICATLSGGSPPSKLFKKCSKLKFIKDSRENFEKLNKAGNDYVINLLNVEEKHYDSLYGKEGLSSAMIAFKKGSFTFFRDKIANNFNNTFFEKNKDTSKAVSSFINKCVEELSNDYSVRELLGGITDIKELSSNLSVKIYIGLIEDEVESLSNKGEFLDNKSLEEAVSIIPDRLLSDNNISKLINKMLYHYIRNIINTGSYIKHNKDILSTFKLSGDPNFILPKKLSGAFDLSSYICDFAYAIMKDVANDHTEESVEPNTYINLYKKYRFCIGGRTYLGMSMYDMLPGFVSAMFNHFLHSVMIKKDINSAFQFLINNKEVINEMLTSYAYDEASEFISDFSDYIMLIGGNSNILSLWKRHGESSFPNFFNIEMKKRYPFHNYHVEGDLGKGDLGKGDLVLARVNWYNSFKTS